MLVFHIKKYGSLLAIVFLVCVLCGFGYWIRYKNKPSQRYLRDRPLTYETIMPLVSSRKDSQPGSMTLREIGGMIVFIFTIPVASDTPLSVVIHDGSCEDIGQLRYRLPSIVGKAHVGWYTLYDVPLDRLQKELPLVLMLGDQGDWQYCADIRLDS